MRSLEAFWESLCRRKGPVWAFLLWPLSLIYGVFSLGWRWGSPKRVDGLTKVISIGNLSMGGSGKSPLVLEVVSRLKSLKPAIVSRGYGGDEPEMLQQAAPGVPVIVDSMRFRGAQAAFKQGCRAVVLDDGFQRRHQLVRDLDILVLDWQRRDLEEHCLPAGRLREPLGSARKAHAVVVTHAPKDWNVAALRCGLPEAFQGLMVFRGDHVPVALRDLKGQRRSLGWLKGRRITALSGIGRPDAFEAMLENLGAEVSPKRFPDHHPYRASDLPREGIVVTTSKDAVKLQQLHAGKAEILILEIRMDLSPRKNFEAMLWA